MTQAELKTKIAEIRALPTTNANLKLIKITSAVDIYNRVNPTATLTVAQAQAL